MSKINTDLEREKEIARKAEANFLRKIAELAVANKELQAENYKLQMRLDACLYSMVLMQFLIKRGVTDESQTKEDLLSLAT